MKKIKKEAQPLKMRITPVEKKSIITVYFYEFDGMVIRREETIRWGHYDILVAKDALPKKDENIKITDFEILDSTYDEVVSVEWHYPDGFPEKILKKIKKAYVDDGMEGLEAIRGLFDINYETTLLPPNKIEAIL